MKRFLLIVMAAVAVLFISGMTKAKDHDDQRYNQGRFDRRPIETFDVSHWPFPFDWNDLKCFQPWRFGFDRDDYRGLEPWRFDFDRDDYRGLEPWRFDFDQDERLEPWRFDFDQDDLRHFDDWWLNYCRFQHRPEQTICLF